jgi:hypothetical protein
MPAITVTVVRSGNVSIQVAVDYATSDTAGANNCAVRNGIASARCDYLATIGTVRFAANQLSANILIPVVDDAYAEGNETFLITLSNPTGAILGSPASATITLSDNETVNGVNPIDSAAFFVRQHYLDFLNREPDPSGFQFWTGEIEGCAPKPQCVESKRINVSAAFYLSIEFQGTGYFVERIYKAAYGDTIGTSILPAPHQLSVPVIRLTEFLADTREAGLGVIVGQPGWEQLLETRKQAYVGTFVQRSRFATAYPTSRTPAQFVNQLFANAGVVPSPAELSAAIGEFGSATNTSDLSARARALRRVAENSILNRDEFNRGFVLMQFFGYLRRNPNDPQDSDYTGYDFWLSKLNQFNGNFVNAEMVKAFITSGEYRHRFGP